MAAARRPRPADALLREEPEVGRADPPLHRSTGSATSTATGSRPYRAGYTPAQRREIEQRLAAGELLGVAATDALELGIDIGLLDCVISTGFPGTVASLRQQWGRAGPPRPRARRPRRQRGRARPVLHARAGDAPRPPRRGGDPRPREPARARRPRARGRVRGAARRRRPRRARRRGARARGAAPGAAAHAGRVRLGRPGLPGRRASRCARRAPTRSR